MNGTMRNRFRSALSRKGYSARVVFITLAAALSASCDVHGISAPGTLASITVTPNATIATNATQQTTAQGFDAEGRSVAISPTWSVAAGGGTVNQSGLFTAGSTMGVFANTVVASVGSISGRSSITVTAGPLASITLTPNPVTLAINGTQQFVATGKDASGNAVAITPGWSVVNSGGSIDQAGVFTAGATSGTYLNTVQVSSGGIRAFATVTVAAGPLTTITVTPNPATLTAGSTQQFVAVGKDAGGNIVPAAITWSVTAAGGSIDANGFFTAGPTPGTFTNTVRAASGTAAGSATVIVTAGPLATLTVTPNPATLGVGTSQQFTAVGRDASGNVLVISPSWSVAAGGGTIDNVTGVFTAGNVAGTYTNTVRASVGALSGTATVNVTIGPLASITVTPNPATVQSGSTQAFSATGKDAGGNNVPIAPVWSVVSGGGTIDPSTGVFTAGAVAGTFNGTIKASSGGIAGTATVTVTPIPLVLTTITVTPNPASVVVNGTQQFSAVGRDQNGNPLGASIVWSVVGGGGSIDANTGLFTAGAVAGTFTNTVRATSGAISGSATVIVTAAPPVLATITVTPNPATLQVNGTQQFAAVGRDAGGNVFPTTVVWSVVSGGGSINASTGLFTAGAVAGTFTNTIRATSGAISGSATVIVTAAPPVLATITVNPNPATVVANNTQQFSAVGRDGNGNLFPITPVWTVVNGGGTIDLNGLFTAGSVAGTFNNTVRASSGAIFGSATVTVTVLAPTPIVNLGAAAPNGIMAGTAVTCVALGIVNADVSISPGNTLTGYPPCVITGVMHLGDAVAAQAQLALTAAYNVLAGLPCPPANIIATNLGGTTKGAGVYCSATSIGVTGTLTLDGGGDPNATFVFQAGTGLTTAGSVVLINGAQAKNVYFQIGSSATLGTASQWQGNILAFTSITLVDNANLFGRALARNGAVTLGTSNVITLP